MEIPPPQMDTTSSHHNAPSAMTNLQQDRVEYELSKYVDTCCYLIRVYVTYASCRYLQLFHSEAESLLGNAAIRGSLNDRIELTIVRLGNTTPPEDRTVC